MEKMPNWKELDVQDVVLEDIPEFVKQAMTGYDHDYDSVVQAFVACLTACAWAINYHAGLTGFQARFVPLLFAQRWSGIGENVGLRIVDYDNLLYPQYEDYFDKTISEDIYKSLVEKARKNLSELEDRVFPVHPDVVAHWQRIAEGNVPFGYSVKHDF